MYCNKNILLKYVPTENRKQLVYFVVQHETSTFRVASINSKNAVRDCCFRAPRPRQLIVLELDEI